MHGYRTTTAGEAGARLGWPHGDTWHGDKPQHLCAHWCCGQRVWRANEQPLCACCFCVWMRVSDGFSHASSASRLYRVVAVPQLLLHFSSDRSHMRRPDGAWNAPPPCYPCLVASATGHTNTLPRYRDMTCDLYCRGAQPRPCLVEAIAADECATAKCAASNGPEGASPCDVHASRTAADSGDHCCLGGVTGLSALLNCAYGQVHDEGSLLDVFGVCYDDVVSSVALA